MKTKLVRESLNEKLNESIDKSIISKLENWGDSEVNLLKKTRDRFDPDRMSISWINRILPGTNLRIEQALCKATGRKDIYFDDTDLVLDDETIFTVSLDSTSKDLINAVKKLSLI
ncbi:hypothetical protein M0Q50_08565 [bacterium]|jgi:hypothetical protein|nr:hypothetical protein [bacterium]